MIALLKSILSPDPKSASEIRFIFLITSLVYLGLVVFLVIKITSYDKIPDGLMAALGVVLGFAGTIFGGLLGAKINEKYQEMGTDPNSPVNPPTQ